MRPPQHMEIPLVADPKNLGDVRAARYTDLSRTELHKMNLKRLFLCVVAMCATAFIAHSQSSVWKITKGDNSLFLGGTFHLLRSSDFPLPAEFDHAYDATSAVYFETDFKRIISPEMQQIVMQRGMFTDESTLETVLSAEAWAAVQDYCTKSGMQVAQLMKFRPWLFIMMVSVMELQKLEVSQAGVDLHFFQRATAGGRSLGELESFESHIDFVTGMGAGHESEMILQSLEDLKELPGQLGELLRAWREGDTATLDRLINGELRAKHPKIHASLIVERNNNWVAVLENLVATPEVEFVLAGVGHMAGPEGLLEQLKQRGYTVEQIKAPVAK
jgi:uncharacterized protein YbaP (TraB family)